MIKLKVKEYLKNYQYNYINIYKYNNFDIEGFKNNNKWTFKDLESKEEIKDDYFINDILLNSKVLINYDFNIIQVI